MHILTHSSVANKIANKTELIEFEAKARLLLGSILDMKLKQMKSVSKLF